MTYLLHLVIFFAMYAIVALSLNLVVGFCGILTMSHAAYFGVGGYTYALATMKLGLGFLPASGLAMLVCGVLSLAISLPAWRFRGDFIVLVSLAVQGCLFSVLYNWSSADSPPATWRNLTNGPLGISGITRPVFFGAPLEATWSVAVLSILLLLVSGSILWLLKASPWGRMLKSMRDDELAAQGLGKKVRLAKVCVLAIASAFAALAGTMYSSYVTFIDPSSASLDQSILFLSMLMVGGAGNTRGPLVGAAVLLTIPEVLRLLHLSVSQAANIRLLIYGLTLILIVHLRPQGLAGEYRLK